MPYLRAHLHRFATIWLCCQLLSLCVFAGAELHEAYRIASAASRECDTDTRVCPIQAITGVPCPMHAAKAAAGGACVMRGLCNNPAASLSALLTVPGVLVDRVSEHFVEGSAAMTPIFLRSLDVVVANDAPPPRA